MLHGNPLETTSSNRYRTHLAVSAMPSSRDAALSPLQVVPRRPPALEGSITTGSDMVVGSQSVTERGKKDITQ